MLAGLPDGDVSPLRDVLVELLRPIPDRSRRRLRPVWFSFRSRPSITSSREDRYWSCVSFSTHGQIVERRTHDTAHRTAVHRFHFRDRPESVARHPAAPPKIDRGEAGERVSLFECKSKDAGSRPAPAVPLPLESHPNSKPATVGLSLLRKPPCTFRSPRPIPPDARGLLFPGHVDGSTLRHTAVLQQPRAWGSSRLVTVIPCWKRPPREWPATCERRVLRGQDPDRSTPPLGRPPGSFNRRGSRVDAPWCLEWIAGQVVWPV